MKKVILAYFQSDSFTLALLTKRISVFYPNPYQTPPSHTATYTNAQ